MIRIVRTLPPCDVVLLSETREPSDDGVVTTLEYRVPLSLGAVLLWTRCESVELEDEPLHLRGECFVHEASVERKAGMDWGCVKLRRFDLDPTPP